MKSSRVAVLLVALTIAPALALGQGDVGRIQRHIDEGRRHFDAGRYAEALDLLEAVEADVDARGGIVGFPWAKARCLEELGRLDEAIVAYRRFLELATEPEQRVLGEQRIRALQERLADQEDRWIFGGLVHGGVAAAPAEHASIDPAPGLVVSVRGLIERDWLLEGLAWPLGVRVEAGWHGTFMAYTEGEFSGWWRWHAASLSVASTLRPISGFKFGVGGGPALLLSMTETVDGVQHDLGREFSSVRWDLFVDATYRLGDVLLGLRPSMVLSPTRDSRGTLVIFTLGGGIGFLFGG